MLLSLNNFIYRLCWAEKERVVSCLTIVHLMTFLYLSHWLSLWLMSGNVCRLMRGGISDLGAIEE